MEQLLPELIGIIMLGIFAWKVIRLDHKEHNKLE